ncbi:hypothetical protein DICVIV_11899 [Dictyocaulus viviparus]|uniref:Uncharacterized protein n=1 Tax=Dictyocaulus viviparus TaxID=29172 RepID=A0A0D8XED0_DICVI|nr:hypothetical protein DICVIV_11899 [Dictyocaulus viviparus]
MKEIVRTTVRVCLTNVYGTEGEELLIILIGMNTNQYTALRNRGFFEYKGSRAIMTDHVKDVRRKVNSYDFHTRIQNGTRSNRKNAQNQYCIWLAICEETCSSIINKKFRKGDECLEDEERSDRPCKVNDDHSKAIIEANFFSRLHEMARQS